MDTLSDADKANLCEVGKYLPKMKRISQFVEVGVVEVHEGALEHSDPSGNLLNLNPIRICTRK